jgi:hypothetical protein
MIQWRIPSKCANLAPDRAYYSVSGAFIFFTLSFSGNTTKVRIAI